MLGRRWKNPKIWLATLLFAVIGSAAAAECRVKDNGKSILIGKFPFASAYRDCLRVYRNHYLKKNNDGESELQLRCRSGAQTIAYVQGGKFYESGIQVAGCAMSKTLG